MKKRWGLAAVLLVAAIGLVLIFPFHKGIDKTITANVYVNGVVAEETAITINGEQSKKLFSDEASYIGLFEIEYYERTCREDMQAKIEWRSDTEKQTIIYSQNASYPSLELNSNLLIDKSMNQIALGFTDGTVIATSEIMYNVYENSLLNH